MRLGLARRGLDDDEFAVLPGEIHRLDPAEEAGEEEVDGAEEEGVVGGLGEPDAALPRCPGEVWRRFGVLRGRVHLFGPFVLG